MELNEIKQLLELLKNTDITELQIERDGVKVKIKREKFISSWDVSPPARPSAQPEVKETKEEAPEAQKTVTITAPIVGMFHRSPAPEAAPFAEVGSVVKKGQVLCIIEAMKLMNEIESDADGTVSKILVENGQPVEYGEPLFIIEPA
ncbi:MAG: acetyl-CoA carboxylase biotin carboxyl carrier protein [Nitrospirae bacterium]|nr:acetyl-CoA carboxylase biotin carboxyl carrier protein [Nitrospirota bacterium]